MTWTQLLKQCSIPLWDQNENHGWLGKQHPERSENEGLEGETKVIRNYKYVFLTKEALEESMLWVANTNSPIQMSHAASYGGGAVIKFFSW